MGQKTNPLCLRLGTTHSHHSVWFEEPKKYSTSIQEDRKIRDFFKNYIQKKIKEFLKKELQKIAKKKYSKKDLQEKEKDLQKLQQYYLKQLKKKKQKNNLKQLKQKKQKNKKKKKQKNNLKQLKQKKQKNKKKKKDYFKIDLPPLGFEGIIRIQIEKQGVRAKKTFVRVRIYSGLVPKFLLKGETLKDLKENIEKQEFFYSIYPTRYPRRLRLELVKYAKEPLYSHPNLIAEFIALQIKHRVPFRQTMKKAIDITKSTGIKGIKIQLAGRIDGKDIARKESRRNGKLPLQIISTRMDYYSHRIQAVYGVLGLKIWIFRN
uniref:Small ribosomal subunit protein uS3c n=1 Tax=Carex agglomerata TaxID=2802308 RepID=A0A8B0SBR8_9POAL|nr:ribosomal protein S3 [Carex agglomerata]QTX08836.1 ribosomal protein S3 [Carex agglomerata]